MTAKNPSRRRYTLRVLFPRGALQTDTLATVLAASADEAVEHAKRKIRSFSLKDGSPLAPRRVDVVTPAEQAPDPRGAAVAAIAQRVLGLWTLETRKSDRLDFHEIAVWNLKRALEEAYDAGRRSRSR